MSEEKQKTIFITISQGMIVRNTLRSGMYELFLKQGYQIIVLLNTKHVPEYLKEEFPQVHFISCGDVRLTKLHRLFRRITHYCIWNDTMRRYFQYSLHYVNRSHIEKYAHLFLLRLVSGTIIVFPFLKRVIRWAEFSFFKETNEKIVDSFDAHTPDIVFSTSITSTFDTIVLKTARRRRVVTVGMPKSWDNATKMCLPVVPDYLLVQNNILKERFNTLQGIPQENIFVTGFSHFDWYARKDRILSREKYLKKIGLDPEKPVLFFGAQGPWFDKDYLIAEQVYEWIRNDELLRPCQMIVRPYFKELEKTPLSRLKGKEHVYYDDEQHTVPEFFDKWDPTEEETIDFVSTIAHSDVLVLVLSTLALDGACTDTPIINTIYGSKFKDGKDITHHMQYTEHYGWVFDTGGTAVARTPEELKSWINAYLKDPSIKSRERALLRDRLCYKVDGKACERVVRAIEEVVYK